MSETRRHLPVWAGVLGAVLFVAVFAVEDSLGPDFNWLSTAVSEHSRDAHGWIQIATFVLVGALFVVFSHAVAEEGHEVPGSPAGSWLIWITGVCLIVSGPFVTDPGGVVVYSPGATWHGTVHGVAGAIAFTLMPLTCFVLYRRLRIRPAWTGFAKWSLAACFTMVAGIVLLKLAQLGVMRGLLGLFQRIVLVTYFGWIFAFAMRLRRGALDSTERRAHTKATPSVAARGSR